MQASTKTHYGDKAEFLMVDAREKKEGNRGEEGLKAWGGTGRAQRRRKRLCLHTSGIAGSGAVQNGQVWLCITLFTPGALRIPRPLPQLPLSGCEHVGGLTANTQCLRGLHVATRHSTHRNTCTDANHTTHTANMPPSLVHYTHTSRTPGVCFSLHPQAGTLPPAFCS